MDVGRRTRPDVFLLCPDWVAAAGLTYHFTRHVPEHQTSLQFRSARHGAGNRRRVAPVRSKIERIFKAIEIQRARFRGGDLGGERRSSTLAGRPYHRRASPEPVRVRTEEARAIPTALRRGMIRAVVRFSEGSRSDLEPRGFQPGISGEWTFRSFPFRRGRPLVLRREELRFRSAL